MAIMSKIETTSKVPLKLTSRTNLGRRGTRAYRALDSGRSPQAPPQPAKGHPRPPAGPIRPPGPPPPPSPPEKHNALQSPSRNPPPPPEYRRTRSKKCFTGHRIANRIQLFHAIRKENSPHYFVLYEKKTFSILFLNKSQLRGIPQRLLDKCIFICLFTLPLKEPLSSRQKPV